MTVFTAALLAVIAWFTVAPAVRSLRAGQRLGLVDRAGAVSGVTSAAMGAVAAHQLLPWDVLPEALWVVPVGAAITATLGAAASWRHLPALARPRWRRAGGTVVEVLVDGALVAVMLIG